MKDGFAQTREKIHAIAVITQQQVLKKLKGNFLHAKMALGEAAVLLENERKKDESSQLISNEPSPRSE